MIHPIVLSGGAGTRLWPVSREANPKPFMHMPDGETLLYKTYRRASMLKGVTEVVTVTNRDYYFRAKDEFVAVDSGHRGVYLLEPMGRNTAPALALSALYCKERYGPGAIMLVLPADHLIADEAAFCRAVDVAAELANQGKLVTFGVRPMAPETGYGYIECGESVGGGYVVTRFVEKPDAERAAKYVASGRFLWNAGVFCFQADVLLRTMGDVCPDVLVGAQACWMQTMAQCATDESMIEFDASSFMQQPDISIDYAVMEKSPNVAVVPCELGWSDVGSWNALCSLVPPDDAGNRQMGDGVFVDTNNTFVYSEQHLVAAVGVRDLIIIDTDDAVLVAHRDSAQDVKRVVEKLKQRGHDAYRLHRTVARPWGTYTVLEEGARFKIKRIEVKPGASLSLQLHHHRSEHWIVVSGMAKVVNGEREMYVRTNESTYIPAGHRHRLENPGKIDLVMIEVQCGDYLGEDDIVRFEDRYGRV